MDKNYQGVIWTNHALDRLRKRGIKQGDAWYTFVKPQQSRYAKSKQTWIYYRNYENEQIEVVAKKNEKGQWLILSVWSNPISLKKGKSAKTKESLLKLMLKSLFGK